MLIDYPFVGYDYYELAEKWGLNLSNYNRYNNGIDEYKIFALYIENFLFRMHFYETTEEPSRVMKAFCKDARSYLKALPEFNMYDSPAWKGLSEVEDDFSFLRLFIPLVGYMWC